MQPLEVRIEPINERDWLIRAGRRGSTLSADAAHDLALRSRRLAELAAASGSADFERELPDLGRDISGALGLQTAAGNPDGGILLRPDRQAETDVWRDLEEVAWEAAIHPGSDKPVLLHGPIVRVVGEKSAAPLEVGKQPLKALLIIANPRTVNYASMDVPAARQAVESLWGELLIAPTVRVVEGRDTINQLDSLLREDPRWDIVHVIAHGTRAGSGRICLEGANGQEDHHGNVEFAGILSRLARPRLVTLHVCASSPLAAELAFKFPDAWVIGHLQEVQQGTLGQFFTHLYEELLQLPPGEDMACAAVPEAMHRAIQALRAIDRNDREWFLPVLYGPAAVQPLLDLSALRPLLSVLEYVRNSRYDDAQVQARQLADNPHVAPAVAQRARSYLQNIERVLAYQKNLQVLDEDLRAAGRDADWRQMQRRWSSRDFAQAPTAGAQTVVAAVTPADQFFQRLFEMLQALRDLALSALGRLTRFQEGESGELVDGCQGLMDYAERRRETRLERAPIEVFEAGMRQLLERAVASRDSDEAMRLLNEAQQLIARAVSVPRLQRAAGASNASWSAAAAAVCEGILEQSAKTMAANGLTGLIKGLTQAQPVGILLHSAPADARLAETQVRFGRLIEEAAQRLPARKRTAAPPPELLRPGKRLAILRWLREDRTAEFPAVAPHDLEQLVRIARDLQTAQPTRNALDLHSLRPELWPLLANEAVPLALVTGSLQAAHPYLCLASLDVGPGVTAAELRDRVEFQAGAERNPGLRDAMLGALGEITDVRRRLLYDARLASVTAPGESTERFKQLATHIFANEAIPAEFFDGLAGRIDRAVLLAAAGRPADAAAEAEAAVADRPRDCDVLHSAFLLWLHHARLLLPDRAGFVDACRRAIAYLGMLAGNRALLTAWVRRRYAVYQLPDPEGSAINEQVKVVDRELNTLADACFQEVQAGDPAERPLVAQLRSELRAEIEGARQTSSARVIQLGATGQAGFVGGFLAAGQLRHLPDIGRDLANVYHRLSSLKSQDEYFQYVSLFGVTYEAFHELVFLFSEWRSQFLEPGPNTLAQLETVLPDEDDLIYGVSEPSPGAAQLAAAQDLPARFPFHATLTVGERARVLSAHAALLALRCQLEVARQELASAAPGRARVVGAFRRLQPFAQHVTDLGYAVAGATADPDTAAAELLTGWVMRVIDQAEQRDKEGIDKDEVRKLLSGACELATTLAPQYPDRSGRFKNARGRLHLACGCYLVNHFKDATGAFRNLKLAYQCDPAAADIIVNFLRAGHRRGKELRAARDNTAAIAVLEEPIMAARAYLKAQTAPMPDVEQELAEHEKELRFWRNPPSDDIWLPRVDA